MIEVQTPQEVNYSISKGTLLVGSDLSQRLKQEGSKSSRCCCVVPEPDGSGQGEAALNRPALG